MQALIQSNVNKAHVVMQSLGHASADTPLTGVINTKRPKMSQKQMAASYLKSVAGNPNIHINNKAAQDALASPYQAPPKKQTFDFFGPINNGIGMLCKSVDQSLANIGTTLVDAAISAKEQLSSYYYSPPP